MTLVRQKIATFATAAAFQAICRGSGNTGEIVCMRSGCGHGHGFDERLEVLNLDQLVNITAQHREKQKPVFFKQLAELLQQGVEKGYITPENSKKAFDLL